MGTEHWLGGSSGVTDTVDTLHDVLLIDGVNENYTFTRAIVTIELSYVYFASLFDPLPTWAPVVAAVYWRGKLGTSGPAELHDSGGDWSIYRGVNWDQIPVQTTSEGASVMYYAPRDGLPLDVNGQRRLLPYTDPTNQLWLSVGPPLSGGPPPGTQLRPFAMSWSSRLLFTET